MKRILALAFLLLLILTAGCGGEDGVKKGIDSIGTYEDIPGVTQEEIYAINALKGSYESFSYGHLLGSDMFLLPDGTFTGFTLQVSDLLSELFGIPFVPEYCGEWDVLKSGLDNRTIDFSGIFTLTPERKEFYYMSIPITGHTLTMYTLADSEGIMSETDVNGRRLGFLANTITEEAIAERYPELSFDIVEASGFYAAAEMLREGLIDGFVVDGTSAPILDGFEFLRSMGFFSLVYTPVSLTTANPEFEPVISVFDKYLNAGGIEKLFELSKECEYEYKRFVLMKSFTDDEKDYLTDMKTRGALVDIGLQHDAYPVSFYNTNDKEFQGVALDILREVTRLTGLEFAPITTSTDTPISSILEKLKTGEISMMTQLLKADSRKNDYIWSEVPYLRTKYALLSKTDLPDLEIYQVLFETVGTVYKTAHEEMFEIWFPKHENRLIYGTTDEAFAALEEGEIDLLMLSENMLLTQTNYREKPGFKINISLDKTLDSYYGYNKNEEILRSIVDKAMAHVNLEVIGNRWMNKVFDYTKAVSDMREKYLMAFTIALLLILIAMVFLFLSNRRLNKNLIRRTATLTAVYESIPDVLFSKDINGAFTSCNSSFMQYAGLPEAEIIGKTDTEIFCARGMEEAKRHLETDLKVIAENRMVVIHENVTYPDDSSHIMETLKVPLIENGRSVGMLGIGRDVTERESKNEQIRVARQSLQRVLDSLPMPIRIVDLESSKIVYVNDNLLELLEYDSAEEICGLDISYIVPEVLGDGTPVGERIALIMGARTPVSIEIDYKSRSGAIIEAILVTRHIDYQGRPSSIGIIKDLTQEKERARILLEAAEREKEANQAKSIFLANMSHEIRTPMNGIIGMTDLLLCENLEGRQLRYVKDIRMSAESLLAIINDILDISKINEGRLQIMPVDVDLPLLLKNVVSMMRFSTRSKNLEFIEDIRINMPEYVLVDDVRLKQIIVNLLGNAIKFTQKGYVKFTAEITGGNLAFTVSDTGIGIKKEDLPLIFTAFEQADRKRNRMIKGTGLGLSITQSLVKLMGGKIWVESEYGAGTSFYVTIPYVAGDEPAAGASDGTEFKYIFAPTAQVLLVDDIQTNLTVGAGLLRLCGITADVAMSGFEAINLMKTKDYDIVFMDHMMPEMDGVESMRMIRGMGSKYRGLPIIALTANAVNESRDLLLASGMNDFLSKPIDKAALMGILQKWLPKNKFEIASSPEGTAGEYSSVLDAAAGIDGLDIDLALSRIGGLQHVLEVSIRQAADSIESQLRKMDGFLLAGDLRGFAIESHGLKGVLANIGATSRSELAAELEIAAKAENTLFCAGKFTVFADEMESFSRELKSVFAERNVSGGPTGEREVLREKVGIILGLLEDFEAGDALALFDELGGYTFGGETDAILTEARAAAEAFSYEKAILVLKKIEFPVSVMSENC